MNTPISSLEREMTPNLKTKLDGFINQEKNRINIPNISAYQVGPSLANYQDVLNSENPMFKEAGSNAGGFYAYFYYKSSDKNIYIMEFYMQNYQGSYKITDDNDKFHRYMGFISNDSKKDTHQNHHHSLSQTSSV